ncbi:AAA family ATPase [Methylomonas sp. MgM2]
MNFKNLFDGHLLNERTAAPAGDLRSPYVYVFSREMELAVSAAHVTQRPILVTGPAGCGKSSFARNTAHRLNWRFLEKAVTSRTEITDLLWEIDQLRRLQDAQLGRLSDNIFTYMRPGIMWRTFDAVGASDPPAWARSPENDDARQTQIPAVALIDEIDKADPDLPNNLLEVLGSLRFEVENTGRRIECRGTPPLIILTSNDERDLPAAFLRRCIHLRMKQPDLKDVGYAHFPEHKPLVDAALGFIETAIAESRDRTALSAAEFLDFVLACIQLDITRPGSTAWEYLVQICALKPSANKAL